MRINPKKIKSARRKRATKFFETNPLGNRETRRKNEAFMRKLPQMEKQQKISNNIRDTKKIGRVAKQKHIDKIRDIKIKRLKS